MCARPFWFKSISRTHQILELCLWLRMRTSYLLVLLSHAILLWACLHHWHCFFGTCFWSGSTLGIFLQHLQTFGLILSWFMHLLWQLFKLPGTSVQFVDFPNQALLLLKSVIIYSVSLARTSTLSINYACQLVTTYRLQFVNCDTATRPSKHDSKSNAFNLGNQYNRFISMTWSCIRRWHVVSGLDD